MFSEYRIVEPELYCQKGIPITRICINPECSKLSLICEDSNCQNCGDQNHLYCSTVKLKAINQLLTRRNQQQKDFAAELIKIQNKFVEELDSSRRALAKKYYLGDLQEKYLDIVEKIYKRKNIKCLTGVMAQDFYQRIRRANSIPGQNTKGLLEDYKKSLKKLIDDVVVLKNKLYQPQG